MQIIKKTLGLFVLFFVLLSILILIIKQFLLNHAINYKVVLLANAIFFCMGIVTFYFQQKALSNKNPNVFIRTVMGMHMIKMFACILLILVYKLLFPASFSIATILASIIIYFLYLILEVKEISGLNKK